MSGIMEAILAELQKINLQLATAPAALNGGAHTPAQPQTDAFGMPITQTPAVAQVPANITEAMVMGLIEPHLDNAPLKAGLQQVLAAMGIARLPEARPDQYTELYTKFQQTIAQHSGGAAATTSIL
jgi:hypothetical protein